MKHMIDISAYDEKNISGNNNPHLVEKKINKSA